MRIERSLRLCPASRQGQERVQSGFTLIEMMVVIAIVGIIIAISMPAYSSWRKNTGVNSAAHSLLAHMKQARTMAMAKNRSVSITFTPNSYTFDADTTGTCGPCRKEVVSLTRYSSSLTVSPTTTRTFSSSGTANSGTITLAAGGSTHTITINIIGRAYLQ